MLLQWYEIANFIYIRREHQSRRKSSMIYGRHCYAYSPLASDTNSSIFWAPDCFKNLCIKHILLELQD
jgi:hypothetical protein